MRIGDIDTSSRRIDVSAQVKQLGEVRTVSLRDGSQAKVSDAVVMDETGQIQLSLWDDQIEKVKVGSHVRVENGYATSYRGRVQLNVGRYGRLTVLDSRPPVPPEEKEPSQMKSQFSCGVPDCGAKFDSIASLQKHIRNHK